MYSRGNEYEVSILVNGRPIVEVEHEGRTFVEGRKDSFYSLKITNRTSHNVLAVPSVDGKNVIDGEPCGVDSSGYVVHACSTMIIPGWKLEGSNTEAGRFQFKPQDSYYEEDTTYVEAMGDNPEHQGLIGFMFFREKPKPVVTPYSYTSTNYNGLLRKRDSSDASGDLSFGGSTCNSTLDSMCVSASASSIGDAGIQCSYTPEPDPDEGKSLGTGMGEAVDFHTKTVEFEKLTEEPNAVLVYFYDTLKNLKKLGVPVGEFRVKEGNYLGNPFPASPRIASGCTPPPGWKSGKSRRRKPRRTC